MVWADVVERTGHDLYVVASRSCILCQPDPNSLFRPSNAHIDMKLLPAIIAISILFGACTTTDPRDRPLSDVYALDSADQEAALTSLSEKEKKLIQLAAQAYGGDSNALHRRTLNQLISEGEALQRNAGTQYTQ